MLCFMSSAARAAFISPLATRPVSIASASTSPLSGARGSPRRAAAQVAALFGLALLAHATPAFAHAHLQRAMPAAGSAVTGSPPSLTLSFTEAVEPRFSTIELQDAKGARVEVAKPEARDNGLTLVTILPLLQPGTYTVIWHVTSVDTHKSDGKFAFTVGQ